MENKNVVCWNPKKEEVEMDKSHNRLETAKKFRWDFNQIEASVQKTLPCAAREGINKAFGVYLWFTFLLYIDVEHVITTVMFALHLCV